MNRRSFVAGIVALVPLGWFKGKGSRSNSYPMTPTEAMAQLEAWQQLGCWPDISGEPEVDDEDGGWICELNLWPFPATKLGDHLWVTGDTAIEAIQAARNSLISVGIIAEGKRKPTIHERLLQAVPCPWCCGRCMYIEKDRHASCGIRIEADCNEHWKKFTGPDNDASGNAYGRTNWCPTIEEAIEEWNDTVRRGRKTNQQGVW